MNNLPCGEYGCYCFQPPRPSKSKKVLNFFLHLGLLEGSSQLVPPLILGTSIYLIYPSLPTFAINIRYIIPGSYTWKMCSASKWLGSPPFISHKQGHGWKGAHNRILRGRSNDHHGTIDHVSPSPGMVIDHRQSFPVTQL